MVLADVPRLWVGQSIREETESGVGVSNWLSLGSWRAPWPASHELSPITLSAQWAAADGPGVVCGDGA